MSRLIVIGALLAGAIETVIWIMRRLAKRRKPATEPPQEHREPADNVGWRRLDERGNLGSPSRGLATDPLFPSRNRPAPFLRRRRRDEWE
jgi:hypothetical protein